ncbi:MAG: hypothetical protein OEZ01_00145 [Candidatus Heimdallarchaeota archaeon]|nr:hypothetical protein [Candidatus Heimdallarchaeota archaeon]
MYGLEYTDEAKKSLQQNKSEYLYSKAVPEELQTELNNPRSTTGFINNLENSFNYSKQYSQNFLGYSYHQNLHEHYQSNYDELEDMTGIKYNDIVSNSPYHWSYDVLKKSVVGSVFGVDINPNSQYLAKLKDHMSPEHYERLKKEDAGLETNLMFDLLAEEHPYNFKTQKEILQDIDADRNFAYYQYADVSRRSSVLGDIGDITGKLGAWGSTPTNLPQIPIFAFLEGKIAAGTGLTRLATGLFAEGLANSTISLTEAPFKKEFEESLGHDYTLSDTGADALNAFIDGVELGIGGRVIGKAVKGFASVISETDGKDLGVVGRFNYGVAKGLNSLDDGINNIKDGLKNLKGKSLSEIIDFLKKTDGDLEALKAQGADPDKVDFVKNNFKSLNEVFALKPMGIEAEEHLLKYTKKMNELQVESPLKDKEYIPLVNIPDEKIGISVGDKVDEDLSSFIHEATYELDDIDPTTDYFFLDEDLELSDKKKLHSELEINNQSIKGLVEREKINRRQYKGNKNQDIITQRKLGANREEREYLINRQNYIDDSIKNVKESIAYYKQEEKDIKSSGDSKYFKDSIKENQAKVKELEGDVKSILSNLKKEKDLAKKSIQSIDKEVKNLNNKLQAKYIKLTDAEKRNFRRKNKGTTGLIEKLNQAIEEDSLVIRRLEEDKNANLIKIKEIEAREKIIPEREEIKNLQAQGRSLTRDQLEFLTRESNINKTRLESANQLHEDLKNEKSELPDKINKNTLEYSNLREEQEVLKVLQNDLQKELKGLLNEKGELISNKAELGKKRFGIILDEIYQESDTYQLIETAKEELPSHALITRELQGMFTEMEHTAKKYIAENIKYKGKWNRYAKDLTDEERALKALEKKKQIDELQDKVKYQRYDLRKTIQLSSYIENYRDLNGKVNKIEGLASIFSPNPEYNGETVNVEGLYKYNKQIDLQKNMEFIDENNVNNQSIKDHFKAFFSSNHNKNGEKLLHFLFDGNGDAAIKKAGENWNKYLKDNIEFYNKHGIPINELENYRIPQSHDAYKIGYTESDYLRWSSLVRQVLDWDKTFKALEARSRFAGDLPLGEEFIADKDEFMKAVFHGIGSRGLDTLFTGNGKYNKLVKGNRILFFKDAPSQIAYIKQYGANDIVTTIINHIDFNARQKALVEIVGTDPNRNFRILRESTQRAIELENPNKLQGGYNSLRFSNIDKMFDIANGNYKRPLAIEKYSANIIRPILYGSKMGSTLIASFADYASYMVTLGGTGSNVARNTKSIVEHLLNTDKTNTIAKKIAVVNESIKSTELRFGQDHIMSMPKRIADFVIRISGLDYWTTKLKESFSSEMAIGIAENFEKEFVDIDPILKNNLKRYDISAEEWNDIRQLDLQTVDGVKFFSPMEMKHLIFDERKTAVKIFNMFENETNRAVTTPNWRQQAWGTLGKIGDSELYKSTIGMFKTFPMTVAMNQYARFLEAKATGTAGSYLTNLAIWSYLTGSLVLQVENLINGKTPEDMDSINFTARALSKGDFLGIIGNTLFEDSNSYGARRGGLLSSPVIGSLEKIKQLTLGNTQSLIGISESEKTHYMKDLMAVFDDLVPGSNLWYLKTAKKRMITEKIDSLVNENHEKNKKKLVNSARKKGQSFWWAPN